jgi:4-carboxymuconolactone decarboxylase
MPRIPLPLLEELTPEQKRVHDAITGLRGGHIPTPYRATLHNPEMTDKLQQLGELLRYRTSLPLRLSELAVLVVARQHDCQYEWHFHAPVALKAGITTEAVEAIRVGGRPPLTQSDEQAVYDYSAELLDTKFVSAPVYARALDALGVTGIVELTALLGYYVMAAMALNAHELPMPAGATPQLPPRS